MATTAASSHRTGTGTGTDHHLSQASSSPSRGPPTRSFSTRSSRPPPAASAANAVNTTAAAGAAATTPNSQYYQHQNRRPTSIPQGYHNQQPQPQPQSHQQPPLHPQQQQQQSHQQHHRRSSSASSRPVQQVLPQNDYETSHLASYHKRSSSRDRPPSASRGVDPSRPHRRSSTRSTHHNPPHHQQQQHSQHQHRHSNPPDMPSAAATTRNGSPSGSQAVTDAPIHTASSSKPGKSRTTIPTQSGKWILGKTIGAGSMGKVKLARKEDGSEQVACKIIPRGSTDDGHQSRAEKERADQSKEIRTAREAAIVTLLNHPHIAGLRDVIRTNYHWYMLFEFVNGGQMLDYIISHGKLKEKQARKFSRQIASALDYCHRNSIVHRDLKIENILISKTGDIKIIDFGLSNLFTPRGHLKTFCGSLYFAAPELLQARAYTGPEVDVWSFGIVLYVLVCGKVPFDDQSMPALHAKIKKGVVDYPTWLSNECKHLLSRMLVTDPKQRASMQEVMSHPWMIKGFNGPPENYAPPREPLSLPLEAEVIHAMQGFNFGSPESIKAQLTKTIESEEYQRAVRMYQRERDVPQPSKDNEKKRGFGFDFYKRRNSANSRDTLTAPSSEALQLGNDPLNAFSPLLSIYYLVREKQDRERVDMAQPPSTASRDKEREREREREKEREREREKERELEKLREREREREMEREQEAKKERGVEREEPELTPELAPPQPAHTNAAAYEMPGEKPTGGRTRQRSRTHGEDDKPEVAKQPPLPPSDTRVEQVQKREGTAAGLLRRFSTRRRREPERLDKDRSHPPMVHVHSPPDTAPLTTRKSFSIRRGRRDMDDGSEPRLRSGSSQPQHRDLLSPPMSAGGSNQPRQGGLGRSTSVNSAVLRRREAKEPPATSGSEQSVSNDQQGSSSRPHVGHTRSVSVRTKSTNHTRRESIQRRRLRRDGAPEANVPEETDLDQEQSGVSTERLDSTDLAKPVYLKGLFSVSTTSGKSVPAIRADIRRVLKQLNVDFTEIKGGFSCRHAPSIDLNKVQDIPTSPGHGPPGGHRRRFSFGGLMRGDERDRDEVRDMDRPPVTSPRTTRGAERDHSYSNSEASVDSIPRRNDGGSRAAPGETSTHVQSDLGGSMVLEFEIFIVKVPLLSLHGIQFKRMGGNTWQFKSMADQILKELRL